MITRHITPALNGYFLAAAFRHAQRYPSDDDGFARPPMTKQDLVALSLIAGIDLLVLFGLAKLILS